MQAKFVNLCPKPVGLDVALHFILMPQIGIIWNSNMRPFFFSVGLIYFYKFLLFRPGASARLLAELSIFFFSSGNAGYRAENPALFLKTSLQSFLYCFCSVWICQIEKPANTFGNVKLWKIFQFSLFVVIHASYFLSSYNLLLVVCAWRQDLVSSAVLKRRYKTLFFFLNTAAPLWIRVPLVKLQWLKYCLAMFASRLVQVSGPDQD